MVYEIRQIAIVSCFCMPLYCCCGKKKEKKKKMRVFFVSKWTVFIITCNQNILKKKKKNTTDGQIKWDVNEDNVFSEHIIKGALCKFGQKKKDKDLHCLNFFFMPKLTK